MSGPGGVPGLPLWVNGRPCHLRALSLTTGPAALPVWEADVDGSRGCAATIDAAVLYAARNHARATDGSEENR